MKLTTKSKFDEIFKGVTSSNSCRDENETIINDERTPLLVLNNYYYKDVKKVFGIRRSSALFILYVIFYAAYLIAGGIIFTVLEKPEEEEIKKYLVRARHVFLNDNNCVQGKKNNLSVGKNKQTNKHNGFLNNNNDNDKSLFPLFCKKPETLHKNIIIIIIFFVFFFTRKKVDDDDDRINYLFKKKNCCVVVIKDHNCLNKRKKINELSLSLSLSLVNNDK
ncbi:hypothetical protein Phum_PHUM517290 [Pediculus humanus corporis]|uniref:Uncharacterized protein n=1 Tax=Pediculus humanus subsp. corporis TaxID=121224 RepID=E0VYR0_PEDHC|nr:uncharacterized protein Phum_PHUM517290 [Pediculus humanus corporis]EEB18516.1 hypothetical protein Phum_PHUM517290 [Pediculus humanus corporis]